MNPNVNIPEYTALHSNVCHYTAVDYQPPATAALDFEKVIAARCAETADAIVVAVITKPIYLKSEREALKCELQTRLNAVYGKQIYVSFDTFVYLKLDGDLSPEEIEKIIADAS